jgi:hypothetical protein
MAENAVEVPIAAPSADQVVEVVLDKGAKTDRPIVSADEGVKSLKEQVEQAKRDSAERLAAKDRIIASSTKLARLSSLSPKTKIQQGATIA